MAGRWLILCAYVRENQRGNNSESAESLPLYHRVCVCWWVSILHSMDNYYYLKKKKSFCEREMNNYDVNVVLVVVILSSPFCPCIAHIDLKFIRFSSFLDAMPRFHRCCYSCWFCCSSSSARAQVCLHSTRLLYINTTEKQQWKRLWNKSSTIYDEKKNVRFMYSFSSCKAWATHQKEYMCTCVRVWVCMDGANEAVSQSKRWMKGIKNRVKNVTTTLWKEELSVWK